MIDYKKISDNGPRITEIKLADLESKISVLLPEDYRTFLLSNNGGRPKPGGVKVSGYDVTDIQILFGIDRDIESSCIEWNHETLINRLPENAIPIASDSGGNVFFILFEKESNCYSVRYLDLNAVYGSDEIKKAPIYKVATTFTEFLSNLID